ncbi:MAG: hypothetical protein DRR19_10285 [Candidatus Parabeggiatoa sp. nov. 1]|nr:MAG: hypothetical protein B6247_18355 [Beggiatoa sp. 4572_84]RKZ62771.1 MAG: hypothetical protein DRR08_05235 [Gammaproteobacteria bacterium]RKZ90374.1 MAG: hypothetical protein DRR19_10285 [Gammaproteobacteria bacterium]
MPNDDKKTTCIREAIVLFELDYPCDSCVWRVLLPNYKPHLDENDPLERGIQKVFQETPADVAKAAIDEDVQMTEQGKASTEIDQVLTKRLNRSTRLTLEDVLAIVRNEPTQLENVKAITLARWQNMKAIAKAVNQRLLECQKQVERETGKRPNLSECQCLLILRLRIELDLNYNAIGAIIGKTEQATRQAAHRCYLKMRPYFKRCLSRVH